MRWFVFILALIYCMAAPAGYSSDNPSLQHCPEGGPGEVYRNDCLGEVRYRTGVYRGEFRHNLRSGRGLWLYSNGAKYEGEFKEGSPDGQGVYTYPNGSRYVGGFRSDKFNGDGVLYDQNGSLIRKGRWSEDNYLDAIAPQTNTGGSHVIQMNKVGNHFVVPVRLNGVVTVGAIVDSGADTVVISDKILASLVDDRAVTDRDVIGAGTVILADGTQRSAKGLRLRMLDVGGVTLTDVIAFVASADSPMLLGQSFLKRFKSWSIDNERHTLNLD